jgi:hypothetical protein
MIEPEHLLALSREDLLALVAALQRQIVEWRARHEAWRAEIDPLKRGGKRPAAPFSKGTRATAPKPTGRQLGAGTCCDRQAPPPEAVTEPPVDVTVLLDTCPAWGPCEGPGACLA